jgi:hypothetical protein
MILFIATAVKISNPKKQSFVSVYNFYSVSVNNVLMSNPVKGSKLLLALASTDLLGFGPLWDP